METLYHAGLSNAVSATVLSLAVACLGRVLGRRPAVLHCLWVLVLLKLVTPSIYEVSVPWPELSSAAHESGSELEVVLLEHEERELVNPITPVPTTLLVTSCWPTPLTPRSAQNPRPRRVVDSVPMAVDRLDASGERHLDRGGRDNSGRLDRANPSVSASLA